MILTVIVATVVGLLVIFGAAHLGRVSHNPLLLEENKQPVVVPEAPEGTKPRYGSRRWARMLYYNGLIDLAELNAFYVQHPENLSDPDR